MSQAGTAAAPTLYPFEFRGTGSAYFGIWIVNLALTIVTVGIFSAWAKVRTRRYFNGSTWVAGHAFDYHASGYRILIGRAIALALLLAYTLSTHFHPAIKVLWYLAGAWLLPWLANSSIRFNARNTSYRNLRFNFTATDTEAFMAIVLWPFLGLITALILWPFAQRQKDYFYINNHTFGGRYFETKFPTWRMYAIFAIGLGVYGFILAVLLGLGFAAMAVLQQSHGTPFANVPPAAVGYIVIAMFYLPFLLIAPAIHTMIVNLTASGTLFDDKHRLESKMDPLKVTGIVISNVALCLVTLGFYYPWAKVRLARYQMSKLTLVASGDVDSYVSEVFDSQSAVGEEIGSVFSFDFGL